MKVLRVRGGKPVRTRRFALFCFFSQNDWNVFPLSGEQKRRGLAQFVRGSHQAPLFVQCSSKSSIDSCWRSFRRFYNQKSSNLNFFSFSSGRREINRPLMNYSKLLKHLPLNKFVYFLQIGNQVPPVGPGSFTIKFNVISLNYLKIYNIFC